MSFLHAHMQKFAAVGAAAVGIMVALPQTVFLQRYRNLTQMYNNGEEKPLDSNLQEITEEVLTRYNLDPEMEANLDIYPSYSIDPVHKGSLQMRAGAVIGLPETMSYCTPEDVRNSNLTLFEESVDWDSPAGSSLMSSLLLSRKAKMFVVAREICCVSTYYVHVQTLCSLGACFVAYAGGFYLNNAYRLRTRMKLWGRFIMYGLIGVSVYYLHLLGTDRYFYNRDLKADKNTSSLGELYAEGGVEYYEKLLQRNVALRELGGEAGTKAYTMYGNKITSLRDAEAPVVLRRDRMLELLKKYQQSDS